MSTPVFAVGQVVRLKSGGPAMTVERVHEDGMVHCVWHDGHTVQSQRMRVEVLEEVEAQGPQPTPQQAYLAESQQYVQQTIEAAQARETQNG